MLLPEERKRAIDLLVQSDTDRVTSSPAGHNESLAQIILRNGFEGYANFTDAQLMRTLQKKVSNGDPGYTSYSDLNEIRAFLSSIMDDFLVGTR